jgi:phage tail sheath protein FI
MPVTPTYPGIYIEELPSSTHTITAAATSITVFLGYGHPFQTKPEHWNQAVEVFSFADFERELGPLFASGVYDNALGYAVNQFFINGGSDAYVIPLQPQYYGSTGNVITVPPTQDPDPDPVTYKTRRPFAHIGGDSSGTGRVRLMALEPTDLVPMSVTVSNLRAGGNTADLVIVYGNRSETFRNVTISSPSDPNYIETRINGISTLIKIAMEPPPTPPTSYNPPLATPAQLNVPIYLADPPQPGFATTFNEADFTAAFDNDQALDKLSIFNLLTIPGVADNSIWSTALAFCERKQAFLILDPPAQASADGSTNPPLPLIGDLMNLPSVVPKNPNGALYFPYLLTTDPVTGRSIELPPSGYVAGIYARTDANRGVWKAPAGLETVVLNTSGLPQRGRMTDQRQGTLNPIGVNCLRTFPGIGTVVFGARTLVTNNTALQQWRYVPVRRMALFLEQTLYRSLGWVVFEPNDNPLWVAIRTSIEAFMLSLFSQGAFQGSTPSQAFQVKCDSSTTTQTDIDAGRVNIIVAFAPLKPAEFVIIKIAQLAGQTQA